MSKKYRTLEDWRTIIEAQEASGESVVAYCERQGISLKYFWSRKRAVRDAGSAAGSSQSRHRCVWLTMRR